MNAYAYFLLTLTFVFQLTTTAFSLFLVMRTLIGLSFPYDQERRNEIFCLVIRLTYLSNDIVDLFLSFFAPVLLLLVRYQSCWVIDPMELLRVTSSN